MVMPMKVQKEGERWKDAEEVNCWMRRWNSSSFDFIRPKAKRPLTFLVEHGTPALPSCLVFSLVLPFNRDKNRLACTHR